MVKMDSKHSLEFMMFHFHQISRLLKLPIIKMQLVQRNINSMNYSKHTNRIKNCNKVKVGLIFIMQLIV